MITTVTKRPRNVDAPRAAAILYGDWGTSKAYVIGLAFAVSGYASFWLIAAMCLLTALVGINYITICKHYPNGGGVYASVRHRSEVISIVGAFLLIADYMVTAAISALSAFQYLGASHPEIYAAGAIVFIGVLNYFGPRSTGGLALLISLPTVTVVVLLGLFCLPHLGTAIHQLQPLHGGLFENWNGFVSVVLALSGVEAIANATGVMKLNPGTTEENPSVSKTSTPAIFFVMLEVCLFTVLLSLGAHALQGLQMDQGDVHAPGSPGVRDYMLRYMAEVFVGHSFGPVFGKVAAWAVSLVIGFLLLSAVNTAVVDLISISFLMSKDGELPSMFQKLNPFGVPQMGILAATILPGILVLVVKDMAGLADLYAVGVVGAIATNLGATSTDKKLHLLPWERICMFGTFLIMAAIEISLLADKAHARVFAVTTLAVGLILRGLASEHAQRKGKLRILASTKKTEETQKPILKMEPSKVEGAPFICAVRGVSKTLDYALQEAHHWKRPLHIIFIRVVPSLHPDDHLRSWENDPEARQIFESPQVKAAEIPIVPCYAMSDSVGDTVVDFATLSGASHLILGAPDRKGLLNLIRGDITQYIAHQLPPHIHLIIFA